MKAKQLFLFVSAVSPVKYPKSVISEKGGKDCKSHLRRDMESWQLLSVKCGYRMKEGHVSCHLNLKGHLVKPTSLYNPSNHSTKSFLGRSEFLL